MSKNSSKGATPIKPTRLLPAQNTNSHGDGSMYQHRDTGVAPASVNGFSSPMGRIGSGYFTRTYSDLISHCQKLSTYDDE